MTTAGQTLGDTVQGWTSDDDFFGPAVIDVDERREKPAPHRFVHGHFEGTATRFAIYLPDAYEGRLVQFLQGGRGGSEFGGAANVGIGFAAGAAYAESNQGHVGDLAGVRGAVTVLDYRASRQTALFATELIAAHYGARPHHRYLYGGSGGGLRSIECAEHCPGVWDGYLPFIITRNGLVNWDFSVMVWAALTLEERLAEIVDATDAGGSGDPFATLDAEQRDALATLYRAGYCRGAESQITPSPLWVLGLQIARTIDRDYFGDFWTKPGHEGFDGTPLIARLRRRGVARVAAVLTAGEARGRTSDDIMTMSLTAMPANAPVSLVLEGGPEPVRMMGATFRMTSGAAEGRVFDCTGLAGGGVAATMNPAGFKGVAVGDTVEFDNADLLAFAYHHRHYLDPEYPEMGQFFVDGRPVYSQRERGLSRIAMPTGRFDGKMILVQNSADKECWPNCARAYVRSVEAALGPRTEDNFRIWWTQNAPHVPPTAETPDRTRLIDYAGMYNQGLQDLIAWVEDDVPPPASTAYRFSDDNAVLFPATATERRGVQPVVVATANGAARADVAPGEPVVLLAQAEAPPGAGSIIAVDWDLDGSGRFATPGVNGQTLEHAWSEPGTHFATVRARSHRTGDLADPARTISNIHRVRVVCTPRG